MNKLSLVIDIVNLCLAGFAVGLASMFALRTEKRLDKAAKLLLASVLVIFIASAGIMNKYMGIVSLEMERNIFEISRVSSLVFFIWSLHTFLQITDETASDRREK